MGYNAISVSKSSATSGTQVLTGGQFNKARQIVAQVTYVSVTGGTSPKLDVVIEQSLDQGVTWIAVGSDDLKFTQATAAGNEIKSTTAPFSGDLRVKWTNTGAGTWVWSLSGFGK